jgi:hypothetical protein
MVNTIVVWGMVYYCFNHIKSVDVNRFTFMIHICKIL